jgi:hypothetical protein
VIRRTALLSAQGKNNSVWPGFFLYDAKNPSFGRIFGGGGSDRCSEGNYPRNPLNPCMGISKVKFASFSANSANSCAWWVAESAKRIQLRQNVKRTISRIVHGIVFVDGPIHDLPFPGPLQLQPGQPGTGFTNISTIFLSFFYLFSIFFLNCF